MNENDIPKSCALKFDRLEHRMEEGEKRFDLLETQTSQMHDSVCGTNGKVGMGEEIRGLKKMVGDIKTRPWKIWQKVTAVAVFVFVVGSFILQLIRTIK